MSSRKPHATKAAPHHSETRLRRERTGSRRKALFSFPFFFPWGLDGDVDGASRKRGAEGGRTHRDATRRVPTIIAVANHDLESLCTKQAAACIVTRCTVDKAPPHEAPATWTTTPNLVANVLLEPGVAEAVHGGYPHWKARNPAAAIQPSRLYDPLQMGVDAHAATFLRLDPPWRTSSLATEELSGDKATVARLLDLLNRAMKREGTLPKRRATEAGYDRWTKRATEIHQVAGSVGIGGVHYHRARARNLTARSLRRARATLRRPRSLFREIKSFIIQIL